MANDSFKIKKSINLEPGAPTMDTEGDIGFDSTSHKLKIRDNSSTKNVVTEDGTATLTNKAIDADSNTITNIENADIKAAAAIAVNKLAALTASRATVTDASGFISAATTTSTEIGYVNGVTSAIQTQLDSKASSAAVSTALANKLDVTITTTGDIIYASSGSTPSRLGIGSSGQVLKVAGGLPTWDTFSGGINYMSANPDAETDTTGYSTYADAAGETPVDGTGGTANITFTRTTSTPLRGSGSFLITKDAADRQGEGVSYDFTIDEADKAKPLQISFDYSASGSYSGGNSSDLRIYIYDVTNDEIIQPAPSVVEGGITSNHRYVGVFQTSSNSTSYRLVWHIATTNADSWTVKFDNVYVGPQNSVLGVPATNWTEFTMTPDAVTTAPTKGTATVDEARWRRIGDEARIRYDYKQTAGGSAGSGIYLFPLPTGLVIDTAKMVVLSDAGGTSFRTAVCGTAWAISTGESNGVGVVVAYDANNLCVVLHNVSGTNAYFLNSSQYDFADATLSFSFEAEVPIAGWSSNVLMSSDADTRVTAFQAYRATNQTGVNSNNSDVKVNIDTVESDTHGAFDTANSRFVAPVPGYYVFWDRIVVNGTNVLGASHYSSLYVNGVLTARSGDRVPTAGTSFSLDSAFPPIWMNSGDYAELYLFGTGNNSVNTLTVIGGNQVTVFGGHRLSGPATIAATETIAARYTGNPPTGTLNTSFNIVTFGTKDYDTHSAYSSGTYTVPSPGKYLIEASVAITATYSADSYERIAVYVNGSVLREGNVRTIASQTNAVPQVCVIANLLSGDEVTIRALSNGTTPSYQSAVPEISGFSIARI